MIWACKSRGGGKRYTFNYDAMKMANDELQMRSDWSLPHVHRRGAAEGRGGRQGASDPEARGPAAPGDRSLDPARRCDPRPVLRHRHHRAPPPSGWAATTSASSARRATPGSPRTTSPRWSRPPPRRWLSPAPRSPRTRIPFGQIVQAGLLRARRRALRRQGPPCCARAPGRWQPWCGRRSLRLDPQGQRHVGAVAASACNGWTYWHFKSDKELGPHRRSSRQGPPAARRLGSSGLSASSSTNWVPSASLNRAKVPQGCFCGGGAAELDPAFARALAIGLLDDRRRRRSR